MSDLHVSLMQQEMEENGELDFIRAHVAAANAAAAGETPAPAEAPAAEVETAEEEVVDTEGSAEEEIPAAVGTDPEVEAEEAAAAEATEAPEAVAPVEDEFIELDAETLGIDEDHVLFTKYGGDLSKGLAALAESQRFIAETRRSDEDLIQENATLRAVLEQMQNLERRMPVQYQSDIDDNPQGLVGEVLNRAAESGYFDEATYDSAIQAWALEDPFAASRLDAQVTIARQMAESAVPGPPSGGPAQPDTNALAAEVDAFKQRNPDFEQLLPAMNDLASQRPVLQRALNEGSATERAQALEDLYTLAKTRSTEAATSQAAKKVILRARAEADQAKREATVVGASRTSAVKTEPTGDRLLERALRELSGLDDLVIEG